MELFAIADRAFSKEMRAGVWSDMINRRPGGAEAFFMAIECGMALTIIRENSKTYVPHSIYSSSAG